MLGGPAHTGGNFGGNPANLGAAPHDWGFAKYTANLMCACLSRQCTMRDSSNTSYGSFQSGLFTIVNSRNSAHFAQISESEFLTVIHQLGPISTSLALDDARRVSLAKSYTLVTHA